MKQSSKDEQQLCRRVVTSWFRDQGLHTPYHFWPAGVCARSARREQHDPSTGVIEDEEVQYVSGLDYLIT